MLRCCFKNSFQPVIKSCYIPRHPFNLASKAGHPLMSKTETTDLTLKCFKLFFNLTRPHLFRLRLREQNLILRYSSQLFFKVPKAQTIPFNLPCKLQNLFKQSHSFFNTQKLCFRIFNLFYKACKLGLRIFNPNFKLGKRLFFTCKLRGHTAETSDFPIKFFDNLQDVFMRRLKVLSSDQTPNMLLARPGVA
ncbi:hypothetical protein BMS3Abin16_00914 [archaeon BMS3Abin16]|nr:hypothetical protein BMS3Abin16_00914 [archaeon BMS3Abin16]